LVNYFILKTTIFAYGNTLRSNRKSTPGFGTKCNWTDVKKHQTAARFIFPY